MAEEKIKILEQFYYAMFKPKFYNKLSKLKVVNIIIYTIILLIFTTVIRVGMPIGAWIASKDGLTSVIMDKIPAFVIENNEFQIEKPFNAVIGGYTIKADSRVDKYTMEDLTDEEKMATICIGKDSMIMVAGGMVMETTWSDMKITRFDNQAFANLIPFIYVYIGFMILSTFIFALIRYLIIGLIFAFIGNNFSRLLKIDLSYWKIFELALYAQTLGHVASTIAAVVGGIGINMIMSFASVVITAFILNGGILAHKGDVSAYL